jgi:hypothetical protein
VPEMTLAIRLSQEHSNEFRQFWREIRIASGYPANVDLAEPEEVARFDGAALAEWIPLLTDAVKTIMPAILGYIIAKRGEVEIDGKKFKNISVQDIERILSMVKNEKKKKTSGKPKE